MSEHRVELPADSSFNTPASPSAIIRTDSSATDDSLRRIRTESTHMDDGGHHLGVAKASFSALSPRAYCFMLDFGATSEKGNRKTNEDQHKAILHSDPKDPTQPDIITDVPFFGVYDGHGGPQCAQFLKDNLHNFILGHGSLLEDPERAIKESILRSETLFMDKCRTEKIESGSTIALALIVRNHVLITANVGDSEIVLCRGTTPVLLTTKHNLGCNEAEVQRVRAAGGRIYHSRVGHPKFNPQLVSLGVSRAIGDAGFKLEEYTDGKESGIIAEPDTKTTVLDPSDKFLIIGCDGLWDVMTYEAAVNFCLDQLAAQASPQKISEAIVRRALELGSTDNITVLFVNLQKLDEHQRPMIVG